MSEQINRRRDGHSNYNMTKCGDCLSCFMKLKIDEQSYLSQLVDATMAMSDNFQARTETEMTLQETKGRTSLAMVMLLVRRTLKVRR